MIFNNLNCGRRNDIIENQNSQKILVTGGAGYIGSTISSALSDSGHIPIILDSLINGTNSFTKDHIFYKGDFADEKILESIFEMHPEISITIHCAGLTSIPESMKIPLDYYNENTIKSIALFQFLTKTGCKKLIYSSSGSIYQSKPNTSITEEDDINLKSPYATSKFLTETLLKDFCNLGKLNALILRYFNPIGADQKYRSGPMSNQQNSILGKIIAVSSDENSMFEINGDHWETPDGTAIRDYIHIWDLALGHVKAIEKFNSLFDHSNRTHLKNHLTINLGSGVGTSVKEFLNAFELISTIKIPYIIRSPRPGDVLGTYANIDRAKMFLGWAPSLSLPDAIKDGLIWNDNLKKCN